MRILHLPGVFRPHSDSWLLAQQLVREPLGEESRVLDVCTGSGVLAVTAAGLAAREVVAVDVDRRAVLTTRINAKLNRVEVRALRGDLFEPVDGERFDLIVSNPPYLPTPNGQIPRHGAARAWEGGRDGRELIDRLCDEVPRYLKPHATLLLVHSAVCGEQQTLDGLARHGLRATVLVRRRGPLGPRLRSRAGWLRQHDLLDPDGTEEVLLFRAAASSRPGCG